jgi:hypothetical protein
MDSIPSRFSVATLLLGLFVVAKGQTVSDPKSESEALMNEAIPFAEKMLEKHGEFYPCTVTS